MGDKTGIEWCDATWNPLRGCSRVSEGCRNCYAERVASRFGGPGQPYDGLTRRGRWTGDVRLVPEALALPLRWKRQRRIFVNSMSDLFHPEVGNETIAAIFGVMAACPQHTFIVLTKRPDRAADWFQWAARHNAPRNCPLFTSLAYAQQKCDHPVLRRTDPILARPWPLPNVWLGVSVEDQASADKRIPLLLQCPAAVRWVSAEPLLGPVDLTFAAYDGSESVAAMGGLSWVVCGGESGHGARPMHPDWARSLRDQCREAGVPFLFKQWGEFDAAGHRVGKKAAGRLLDGVLHDEYPEAP